MSIIYWILIILFSLVIGVGIIFVIGLIINFFKTKSITKKALTHTEQLSTEDQYTNEKEVSENESRNNRNKFREFEKLRRSLKTTNNPNGRTAQTESNSVGVISASGKLQDAGILRNGHDGTNATNSKILELPD